jgi:hypothetical protein
VKSDSQIENHLSETAEVAAIDMRRNDIPSFDRYCVWQLLLAHFGGLIWPTLGRCRLGEAFA